jgi:cytochrome P450 family 135
VCSPVREPFPASAELTFAAVIEQGRFREEQLAGGLPPGPDLPPSRQTARMAMRPLGFVEELRARFGEAFTIRILDEPPWVTISDPELIGQVFKAPPEVLLGGEPKRVVEPILGANSVLLLDGDRHMEQRKLLLPLFAPGRIESYEEAMRAAAERAIGERALGAAEPAASWTRTVALEAILGALFGAGDSRRLGPLRDSLRDLPVPGNAREAEAPAFRDAIERVDRLIFSAIDDRAAETAEGEDVLSLLIQARHEDGSPLSRVEIRDELMSLLAAGYETTATTMAWALERLARNPEALTRATEEAEGGGGPYTDAVVRETLRVRPAVPFVPRAVKAPFELAGYLIPPGTTIMAAILLLHHRPEVYPEPLEFRPERFLGSPPDPHTWLPFGGGVRRCIGARFALHEMRVVLSTLLSRVTLRGEGEQPEAMRSRDVTLTPARGAPLLLESR